MHQRLRRTCSNTSPGDLSLQWKTQIDDRRKDTGGLKVVHGCLFAIFAKAEVLAKHGTSSAEGCFAGTNGQPNSIYDEATPAIGIVMIVPDFQRTCISTDVIGLLLHELLDPLPPYGTGNGLRRVQWQCHADNHASRRSAERMGFRYEGTNRWCRVLPEGKAGAAVIGKGRMFGHQSGRNSCMLAIDWEEREAARGTRDQVGLMRRLNELSHSIRISTI